MGTLAVLWGLWAIGAAAVATCGGWTRAEGRCRNPRKGLFNRCQHHGWQLVTGTDVLVVVLCWVGYQIVTHYGGGS
ncbi:hypothetical protein [Wenjunlia tyrosinilytica]|uniref:Uncharacterized protein n=1 Tax=Wenjunlia tyrosinilytica TaxID=1544741 RepID=A0A917ZTR5_9ACTN|nr:hypothetical protein [Wenjunlia tyrosinilytica]GGO94637.1 hypothetical protein GCM10012280_50010 [Wenjunlia tyrosinilytica]